MAEVLKSIIKLIDNRLKSVKSINAGNSSHLMIRTRKASCHQSNRNRNILFATEVGVNFVILTSLLVCGGRKRLDSNDYTARRRHSNGHCRWRNISGNNLVSFIFIVCFFGRVLENKYQTVRTVVGGCLILELIFAKSTKWTSLYSVSSCLYMSKAFVNVKVSMISVLKQICTNRFEHTILICIIHIVY